GAKKFRLVIMSNQWNGLARPVGGLLIKLESPKVERPLLIRYEAHFPIRRPKRISIDSRRKSDPRLDAACQVVHPDVRFACSRLGVRNSQTGAVWRDSRCAEVAGRPSLRNCFAAAVA